MISAEKELRPSIKGSEQEPAKKEWHHPRLRKLPIAATSADIHNVGNDGNMGKSGHAGGVS